MGSPNKRKITIPDELQYIYYGICELVDIATANDLLDSGKLAKWAKDNNPQHSKGKV